MKPGSFGPKLAERITSSNPYRIRTCQGFIRLFFNLESPTFKGNRFRGNIQIMQQLLPVIEA